MTARKRVSRLALSPGDLKPQGSSNPYSPGCTEQEMLKPGRRTTTRKLCSPFCAAALVFFLLSGIATGVYFILDHGQVQLAESKFHKVSTTLLDTFESKLKEAARALAVASAGFQAAARPPGVISRHSASLILQAATNDLIPFSAFAERIDSNERYSEILTEFGLASPYSDNPQQWPTKVPLAVEPDGSVRVVNYTQPDSAYLLTYWNDMPLTAMGAEVLSEAAFMADTTHLPGRAATASAAQLYGEPVASRPMQVLRNALGTVVYSMAYDWSEYDEQVLPDNSSIAGHLVSAIWSYDFSLLVEASIDEPLLSEVWWRVVDAETDEAVFGSRWARGPVIWASSYIREHPEKSEGPLFVGLSGIEADSKTSLSTHFVGLRRKFLFEAGYSEEFVDLASDGVHVVFLIIGIAVALILALLTAWITILLEKRSALVIRAAQARREAAEIEVSFFSLPSGCWRL